MNRKEFIRSSVTACAVVLVGGTLLESCKKDDSSGSTTAPDANFDIDLTDSSAAALNTVGGSITKNSIVIIRTDSALSADSFSVVSGICTHAGCTVNYNKSANQLICPCHEGKFNTSGSVLSGPPSSPLKKYTTTLNGNVLTITA